MSASSSQHSARQQSCGKSESPSPTNALRLAVVPSYAVLRRQPFEHHPPTHSLG